MNKMYLGAKEMRKYGPFLTEKKGHEGEGLFWAGRAQIFLNPILRNNLNFGLGLKVFNPT